MVEHARPHPRLVQQEPAGLRYPLALGRLYVPPTLVQEPGDGATPLIIHFHGAPWLPECAAATLGEAGVVAVQLGSGSSAYAKPFAEQPQLFRQLLEETARVSERQWGPVILSGWSAGYGAIREILRQTPDDNDIAAVVLLDGLHASYATGKPGPLESDLETDSLAPFLAYARRAAEGQATMLIEHTEIFPGTFASTTETADYLLRRLELPRRSTLAWGPLGTQQLSEARRGRLVVRGYAGNSAPDHVDLLHAAATFWQEALELAEASRWAAAPWQPLFDGRSLDGWEGAREVFRVQDGAIVGGWLDRPIPHNEFLCTERDFGDFELQFEAKLTGEPDRNAGVQFRSQRVPDNHEVSGYQCDLAEHAGRPVWGWLYDESRRNRFLAPADGEPDAAWQNELRRVVRDGQWNAFVVRCRGPRIQTWVNGFPVVDYVESDPNVAVRGVIGLQIHGGPPAEAWYRHVRIRELAP
jgi:hypothetical protein